MPKIRNISEKQLLLLNWWCPSSPYHNYDAVICDGAVRSGKTTFLSLSFVLWAMSQFHNQDFAICAKTLNSLRRNVLQPLFGLLREQKLQCIEKQSKNYFIVKSNHHENRFHLFGGKDEGSAALIQGITLAGVMMDEVALMPRSFVEQALARCSIDGSRFWFNCNPDNPNHWFYKEWIEKQEEKNALYLHFMMKDNPALTDNIRKRYESLYSGTFYRRFVKGEWVSATGVVYPMFSPERHVVDQVPECEQYYISCDYGTINPTSMGLWGEHNHVWYRLKEFYYNSKEKEHLLTDEEYYKHLQQLAGNYAIKGVIVDPSAASFMECIRRHGVFPVIKGKNEVLNGIRRVSDLLQHDRLRFHSSCKDSIREFSQYVWDSGGEKGDVPKKQYDHAMDDIRYLVNTIICREKDDLFMVTLVSR